LLTVVPFSLSVLATLNSYLTAGAERGTATSTSTRPGTTSGFFPNGVNGTLNSSGGASSTGGTSGGTGSSATPSGGAGTGAGGTSGGRDTELLVGGALAAAGAVAAAGAYQHSKKTASDGVSEDIA